MADDEKKSEKKGMKLTSTFMKAAAIGLSIAFGFYVMGTFDFVMFHELPEGQAFIKTAGPFAENMLKADIPILGFSIADTFLTLADFFNGLNPVDVAASDLQYQGAMEKEALVPSGWDG